MIWPDRLRLPFRFEAERLRRDLDALAGAEWTAHFVSQNYEGDWSAIPLRGVAGARHPIQMIFSDPSATAFEDTPFLVHCPALRQVIEAFQCEVQSTRLMRLAAGSIIKEHSDHDLSAEDGMARIHVPVVTNPEVTFEVNRRPVVMAPGEAWYLRLSDPHRAANAGSTDRVHLVLDMVVNNWLRGVLDEAAAMQAA